MANIGQKIHGLQKRFESKKRKKEEATGIEDIHKNVGYSERLSC
jgi:hypothetical protein